MTADPFGHLAAVLVTFDRPESARATLERVLAQTRPPDSVFVIDNHPEGRTASDLESVDGRVRSHVPGRNLGPAGGLRLGAHLACTAGADWILFVDDDDPPLLPSMIEELGTALEGAEDAGSIGGIGACGARFLPHRARMQRLRDDELVGVVEVDAIGGNQFPVYRAEALAQVGGPDADLFFGYEELMLGLDLQRAGWRLVESGDLHLRLRSGLARGVLSQGPKTPRRGISWREYYNTRNLVTVARRHGGRGAVTAVALRSIVGSARRPGLGTRRSALAARSTGLADGLRGKLGQTIAPGAEVHFPTRPAGSTRPRHRDGSNTRDSSVTTAERSSAQAPRVLVVIDTLGPGGAEESMKAVLPLVREAGINVEVGILRSIAPEREQALRDRGVPVRHLGPAEGPIGVGRAIDRELRAERPNLLHVTLFNPLVGGALAGRHNRVPVLASIVNTPPKTGTDDPVDTGGARWKIKVLQLIEAFACRRLVDHIHAVTPGVAEEVHARFHIPTGRITVAPRGRDDARFHPPSEAERREARHQLGLGDSEKVIVALARHEPSKGLVDLVDATALLVESHPRARVLVAGRPGSTTADIEAHRTRSGMKTTIELLGDRSDPERLLAAADVFVLPSRREGTSGATIEAMATGLPVVATDVDGLRGITRDGVNARVVPVADPARLAGALAEVLDDEALRGRLRQGALATFRERFTLDVAAAALADLYRREASVP